MRNYEKNSFYRRYWLHWLALDTGFAGLKAVGESVDQPSRYYDNNVHGSQVLLQACADAGVFSFVLNSSATVYGEPAQMPVSEACPVGQPTNPYGRSKLMVEDILRDVAVSDPRRRHCYQLRRLGQG